MKHPPLVRRTGGQFHTHEWSLHGSPCGPLAVWAKLLMREVDQLTGWRGLWVDASHSQSPAEDLDPWQLTQFGQSWDARFPLKKSPQGIRSLASGSAYALLNGNHFTGTRQLVILDPAKKDSLERKLEQLTNVVAFISTSQQREPWPFLEKLPNAKQVPVIAMEQLSVVAALFTRELSTMPELKGLVLAGGASLRMGEDKSTIAYHGMPQRDYVGTLIKPFCTEVFLSTRPGQNIHESTTFPVLEDSFTGLGPLGAILTALRHDPDSAWLVVACDMPLVDNSTIQYLVQSRAHQSRATAFRVNPSSFPEPMLAIWEPDSYAELLNQLAYGGTCPRKYLIQADCKILDAPDGNQLLNANTPEERKLVMDQIRASRPEF